MKKLLLVLLVLTYSISYSSNGDKKAVYSYDNRAIDSLDIKINSFMGKKEFRQAASLMLDKGKLLFGHGMYINTSTILESAISVLNKIEEKKRDSVWNDMYVECLNWKGAVLSYMSNFDKALECYITIEKYNKNKNNKYSAKAYNGMGIVFATNGNNSLAEEYYKKALYFAKKVNNYSLFPIYSNLGAMFLEKQEFDSAMIYFLDAHKMAIVDKDREKEINSLLSLALVNANLSRNNLALKYYNEANDMAVKDNNYLLLSFIKSNLVAFYLNTQDYSSAFTEANKALNLSRQTGSIDLEAKALKALSKIYEQQGDYKKSLEYLKAGLKISDSASNHGSDDKLLRQKADFDLYRVHSEQELMENKFALEIANRKINNIITWLSIVPLLIIIYLISRGLKKQYKLNKKLTYQIENIRINDANLKEEIAIKSRDLASTSLFLSRFNELTYTFGVKLKVLKANVAQRGKDIEIVREMEDLLSMFVTDHNLTQFKQNHKQESIKFHEQLDILYPELTTSEKQLCGLISLNLSTKEISALMAKSTGSIEVAKTRIRKKMNIGNDVNLVDLFCQIKSCNNI